MPRSKHHYSYYIYTPQGPIKFSSISLYNEPFSSYTPFFGKVHWMTPNDLHMFKGKIPTCIPHVPPRPKFSSVSLYIHWPVSSYGSILGKCTKLPQITLTCSRSKIPICMLHTPMRPKFLSVLLYDEPFYFWVTAIFFFAEKVDLMTPNDLVMFQVKNTNMHIYPRCPNFHLFHSTISQWWLIVEQNIYSKKYILL